MLVGTELGFEHVASILLIALLCCLNNNEPTHIKKRSQHREKRHVVIDSGTCKNGKVL